MKSLELRRQRAALVEEMHDLTDGRSWTHEQQVRWSELDKKQRSLGQQIATAEQTELDTEMRTVRDPAGARTAQPGSGFGALSVAPPQQEHFSDMRSLRPFERDLGGGEYREAFGSFLRRGTDSLNVQQRNLLANLTAEVRTYTGLNEGTGSEGGFMVPIGFQRELETKLKAYSQMRKICRILSTSTGNTLDWPTMDDTSVTGEFLAEAAPVDQQNPTFGQIQFLSFLASSKQVLLSVQLLQDSAFDVESELGTAFAIRIGRIVNTKYTLGSGTGEPQGLITAIKADAVPNIVNATGSNSNDGISGNTEANSIGSDDLDNLIAAVDPLYRPNGSFHFHYKTLDFLRKLKDKYGRPLWNAGLSAAQPDTIYGYPFSWSTDMDQIGAGLYPVLFGDFSKHVIRDTGGVTLVRFNELYMPMHQIGFQAFLRTDSRRLQQSAFALLYNPLS